MMEQVVRQDQELAVRIRQLREEDVVLVRQARQVNAKVCTLAADADALASHNPIAKKEVTEFADACLQWIIRVRKQEAALATWYQESFNRDRGVGD